MPVTLTKAEGRIQQHAVEIEGRRLILIDLAADSSQDTDPVRPPNGKIIVLTGSPPLALVADSVHPAIDAGADQMDELPSVFAGAAKACFPKVLRLEEQVALVLDPAALAEIETCAAASTTEPPTRQTQASQSRESSPAVDDGQLNASAPAIDTRAIEDIIAERLQTIISRHVQEAVVHALRRHIRVETLG